MGGLNNSVTAAAHAFHGKSTKQADKHDQSPSLSSCEKQQTEYRIQSAKLIPEPTRYIHMRFSAKPVDWSIQSGCIRKNQPTAGV